MKYSKVCSIVITGLLVIISLGGCKRKSDLPKTKPKTIHEAAMRGDKAAVEEFLAQGARVNGKDRFGLAPLHWAAWHGNRDVVELLLVRGADIHAMCREGHMTPLHYSAAHGHYEIVELLVANGADVNAKNKKGGTPLGASTMGRGDCMKVAEFLIANGSDVNAQSLDGLTPLHYAVINGQPEILKMLLSEGANPHARGAAGKTPLERAIILLETEFRRGSAMAERKKQFEACVQTLREHREE